MYYGSGTVDRIADGGQNKWPRFTDHLVDLAYGGKTFDKMLQILSKSAQHYRSSLLI